MLLANNSGGSAEKLYSSDVFSTYLYTGNGSTQTINNGIDLAGKGGLVWIKDRDTSGNSHVLVNTSRGVGWDLYSDLTAVGGGGSTAITAFSSNGFTVGNNTWTNGAGSLQCSWTFRNADKFFSHTTVTKSAGSNATVSFPNLSTLGMVVVKRTDNTGSWYVWHRSLTAGKLLYLEQTAAEATLGHITVSGTTVTLVNSVIADGSYVIYAWAHDTSADGIIQCGSFTTDASGNFLVTVGWESQWIELKAAGTTGNWIIADSMRGLTADQGFQQLSPNTANSEALNQSVSINSTGFKNIPGNGGFAANTTYVFMVIRRPNKPPTTGTQVYNAIARTGTGAAATVTGVGFAPDVVMPQYRSGTAPSWNSTFDRLRGALALLNRAGTNAENASNSDTVTAFGMDGVSIGADASTNSVNRSGSNYINWFFRRAQGFMSTFAYTGTGSNTTQSHDLAAIPDLLVVKSRSAATDWQVWCNGLAANEKLVLNSNAGKVTDATAWNSTLPTSTNISLGTASATNANTATFIAYAFSNLPGIQKIGTYVGDGTSGRVIDCGFSAGARFVCIKAISTTGSWLVSDTARGIVSGNDPYLQLNSTAAEVTTEDWLDPASSGFIVNNVASSNANANGVTYMFWAIS